MHDCIHKIVFITNDALPSIKIPQSSDFDLQTGDSTEIVAKFMPSNDDPMIALIYCTYSELPILSQIIEMFNKQNLSHFFAVHIEEDNHNLETNAQVAFVWENNLSLSEFLFTTSYQFRLLEQRMKDRKSSAKYLARLLDMKQDQEDLIKIGRSLSTEKNMPKLLRQILMLSKKITGADAGSIYLVEEDENGKRIRFKYSHTFSKDLPLEEFVIPFDTNSIAGYVAVTGKVLNIPDVYKLSPNDPISFNKKFDLSNNYRSTSMIVIPMRNHANEVIGVVQLINCKEPIDPTFSTGNEAFEIALNTEEDFREKVRPFDRRYESLMESVAAQAAIAIENNRMIQQIQNQFEEFVKASVSAIESRDPATSGHSFRVAEICRRLALAINTEKGGAFAQNQFTDTQIKELEFAALLHDFGKVYIDPSIFMKEKKLYPFELQNLILKLNYLYKNVELQYTSDFFKNADTDQNSSIQKIETEKSKFL
ncbi:MAG TPA: GAF domain-containing protein, partial [Spirochaetota bacterium]|nr:GAF domain-containing protein [Spirochaetota bacterium]